LKRKRTLVNIIRIASYVDQEENRIAFEGRLQIIRSRSIKCSPNSSGHSIIYRLGMNPKIQLNFKVFSHYDFIARITQHIPDKIFQLVRYYGWYSNKMRGQCIKQTDAGPEEVPEGEVMASMHTSPARSPPRSGSNSSRKSGKPTRSCARTATRR